MEKLKNFLFELCRLSGVSGCESELRDCISKYLGRDVEVDSMGSAVCVCRGKGENNSPLLLDAHLDRIGLIVTDISEKGFIKVDKVGGIDLRTALDAPVVVHGKEDACGIICCMPPHLSDGNESKAASIEKIWIDLGLPADKVRDLVSIGDSVSFYAVPKELLGDRVTASALDNRAGVCAVVEAFKNICKAQPERDVIMLLSSQEETFATGAKTSGFRFMPEECICVDVSFAAQPGIDGMYSGIELGKGPMLAISPILDRPMFNRLRELCEAEGIDYQLEPIGGRTGTNADSIAVTGSGVKCALVSVPERNMHTQAEIVDLNDIRDCARLIEFYALNGGAG